MNELVEDKEDRKFPKITQSMDEYREQYEESKESSLDWVGGTERDFTFFLVTKQPYISENYYSSPLCKMDDGMIILLTILGLMDI